MTSVLCKHIILTNQLQLAIQKNKLKFAVDFLANILYLFFSLGEQSLQGVMNPSFPSDYTHLCYTADTLNNSLFTFSDSYWMNMELSIRHSD